MGCARRLPVPAPGVGAGESDAVINVDSITAGIAPSPVVSEKSDNDRFRAVEHEVP